VRAYFALAVLILSLPVQADPELLAGLNAARASGCGGSPGVAKPFVAESRLDAAARLLAQSVQPGDALARTGYRASKWALVSLGGANGVDAIVRHVATGFCARLTDAGFLEVGIHRRMGQTWIVFAAPFAPPAAADAPAVSRRVLDLVNAARASARSCGDRDFAAAGPLALNETLYRAAAVHSEDMAARGFFSHDGSDGSSVLTRATRAGYAGRAVGENIAAGQNSAEGAVDAWVKSPPHCANLMSPGFTEMGLAYAVNPASPMGIYWTQVFGAR